MAATIGATLSGVTFPLRHAGIGPYISSAGSVYYFGRDSTFPGNAHVVKATDPMASFPSGSQTQMSSANSTAIEAMCCVQNGDTIHVFSQLATGAVYNNSYDMATDAWRGASAVTVAAAGFAPTAGYTFVSAVYRPTAGELVLGYCAGLTAMSSGFHMVRYARVNASTGAVIGSVANVDNGGSVDWANGVAVLGASDRVHFFLNRITATAGLYQRTLTAANALQTFPGASVDGIAALTHPISAGVSFVDTGTTRVRVPYRDAANTKIAVAKLDSADAPTVTTDSPVSDTNVTSSQSQYIHALANNTTTLHLLYVDSVATDVYHDTSAGGGGAWGTDVNESAGTFSRLSANVYARAGSTVLAIVWNETTAGVQYAEITLAAPPPDVQVLNVPQLVSFY